MAEPSSRMFIVRHGQSTANVDHIVVSKVESGVPGYGLTEMGREQAKEAGVKLEEILKSEVDVRKRLIVISSEFKRARETAELIHEHFKPENPLQFDDDLRERCFGDLDLKSTKLSKPINEMDPQDPTHTLFDSESVVSVFERMSRCLLANSERNKGKILVFVSHNDPINILLAPFEGKPPKVHKSMPVFGNCEIREVDAKLTALKETKATEQ